MGLTVLDLRHITSYGNKFLLNSDWTIKFKFTVESNQDSYELYLGKGVPPPNGFSINGVLPEFFSIIVEWFYPGSRKWVGSNHYFA